MNNMNKHMNILNVTKIFLRFHSCRFYYNLTIVIQAPIGKDVILFNLLYKLDVC